MPAPIPDGRAPRPVRGTDRKTTVLLTAAALVLWAALVLLSQSCLSPNRSAAVAPSSILAKEEPTGTPVPETPPPTPMASLSLESQPDGATVEIDGTERGKTPLLLERLDVGSHQVKLALLGRQEWQESVTLSPDESKQLSIDLQEIPKPTPTPTPVRTGPVYPLAVMVENFVDARPQSGLARADVVYEALVEGGITRFMAIYIDGEAEAIGPVRSARHYYVYLAAEFNASYVHIGSSPQGYAALTATRLTRLDETYGDPGFWRIRSRYAPHNAYTDTDLIRSSLDRVRRVRPGSWAGFRFREDSEPIEGTEAGEISLVYPGGYRVHYDYSPDDRLYLRYMEGLPHTDVDSGEQVSPRNLVVQFVRAWVIDEVGRLDMEQVGEGKALFFRDGVVTEGYWYKPSYGNYTEWYDSDWKPLQMNPGKIWVQVVPQGAKVSY